MKQFLKWLLSEKPLDPNSVEYRIKQRGIHYRGTSWFCY